MLKLRALELLDEQGKTKYTLYKGLGMSYQNFNKMINNETRSIRYENIEAMCIFFNVEPNELFEYDFNS
jgi:putative transcriptional regulator